MNLTPHVVIETIRELGGQSSMWASPQPLPMIIRLLSEAVLFRFGTVHPGMEHKDFALDLNDRGMFDLPYPVTAFSFSGFPHNTEYVDATVAGGGMMVLAKSARGLLCAIMCTEMRDEFGRPSGGVPVGFIMDAKLGNPKDGTVDVSEKTYPILAPHMMRAMYGAAGEAGHEVMRQRLCSNLVGCMGMAVMLMSKGVAVDAKPAPGKVNKARELKGKPRINDSYTVRIVAGDMHTISTDGGDESITGHVRGAPRIHWRRGHFRVLNRGAEGERVVPVAPCLVGGNEFSAPIKAKTYDIARPA